MGKFSVIKYGNETDLWRMWDCLGGYLDLDHLQDAPGEVIVKLITFIVMFKMFLCYENSLCILISILESSLPNSHDISIIFKLS